MSWKMYSKPLLYTKSYHRNWNRWLNQRQEKDINLGIFFQNIYYIFDFITITSFKITVANTFYKMMLWFKLLTRQFYLKLETLLTFHGVLSLDIFLACFSFLTILKFHEKYLNSCEGKKYVRRKLKCISILITLIRLKPFLRL